MAYIHQYVSHSCIRRRAYSSQFPIKFNKKILMSGFAGLTLVASILPNYADAVVSVIMPNSITQVLRAATNLDPNPNKGLGGIIQTVDGKALLAFAGPSGTMIDVIESAKPGRISVYVVRTGDTLSEIADMFDVSVNTILWANNLKNARDVHPGDILTILPIPGVKHTVVRGDTLKSLAKKYGSDADDIALFNELDSLERLAIGTVLIIPGGELTVPAPVRSGPGNLFGAGGPVFAGYYINPIPSGIVTQRIHGWNGIDLGAPRGTPVHAAAAGTVIIARSNGAWNGGYGNYIVIAHDNGTQTLYSHFRNVIVSPGQSVSSGQIIGYVGSTGRSTGAHLHFEVRGAANPLSHCRLGSICHPH